jgi:hypothetical protein
MKIPLALHSAVFSAVMAGVYVGTKYYLIALEEERERRMQIRAAAAAAAAAKDHRRT